MSINRINPTVRTYKRPMHPLAKGAIIGAGVSAGNAVISRVLHPQEVNQLISDLGGVKNYAKHTALGILSVTAFGAISNFIISKIVDKAATQQPPRAAN